MNRISLKLIVVALMAIAFVKVNGQNTITDLDGFRLGQFREAATNKLGKPAIKDKYDDGFEYETYILKPDTTLYMNFEFAPGYTDVMWSIQISGSDSTADIMFKGLKLGMSKERVEKIMGKASKVVDIEEYGERWEYDKANYSLEISKKGKLTSVKIKDTYSTNRPDVSKLPVFKDVAKALTSKSNSEILSILAPGVEIYYKDTDIFFSMPLQTELKTDKSKVFSTIRTIAKGIDKVNIRDSTSYEECMRVMERQNVMHVMKIHKGATISEMVFQYTNGKYLIWEIRTRKT
jgi:hypothetical protein